MIRTILELLFAFTVTLALFHGLTVGLDVFTSAMIGVSCNRVKKITLQILTDPYRSSVMRVSCMVDTFAGGPYRSYRSFQLL